MGLDISLCKSENWEKSLRAIEAEQSFYCSINEKEWFSDWYQAHKEEYDKVISYAHIVSSTCNPYEDSNNIQIYNRRLKEFCEKWDVTYKELPSRLEDKSLFIQIDTGIEEAYPYYVHSSYNDIGVNSILRALKLMDLYEIFGVSEEDLEINPNYLVIDWITVADRASFVCKEIKKHTEIGECAVQHIIGQLELILKFAEIANHNPDNYRVFWSY